VKFYKLCKLKNKWIFREYSSGLSNKDGKQYHTCYFKTVAKDLVIIVENHEKTTKINYLYFAALTDDSRDKIIEAEQEEIELSVECRAIQIINSQYAFLALKNGSWLMWNILNKSIDSKFDLSNKLKKGPLKSFNIVKYPFHCVYTKSDKFLVLLQYDILYLFELNWDTQSAMFVKILILSSSIKSNKTTFKNMENKTSIRSSLFLDSFADKITVRFENILHEFFLRSSGFEEIVKKENNLAGSSRLGCEGLFNRNGNGIRGKFIDFEDLPAIYLFVDKKVGMLNLLLKKSL
jgi:hypothetical protein